MRKETAAEHESTLKGAPEASLSAEHGLLREAGLVREATLIGVRWFGIVRLFSLVVSFAAAVVLARLIDPAGFGHAAVALIIVDLAAVVSMQGAGTAIIQLGDVEQRHLQAAMGLSLLYGASLFAVTIVVSVLGVAPLMGRETAALCALASTAWLISAFAAVPQALLQRGLEFKRIALIDLVSLGMGSVAAVAFALADLGASAMVLGSLVALAVSTVFYLLSARLERPSLHRRSIAQVARIGIPVSGSSIVFTASRNVDYAILAARLSPAQVGLYWRAFQLGNDYQGKISSVLVRLSLPVYARCANVEQMRRARARITRAHATIVIPLLAYFIVVAPILVPWLFGPAWKESVEPAQILAVAGMISAVMTGNGPLLIAAGKSGVLLAWNVIELAAYATVVFLIAPYGIVWVAVGVSVFGATKLIALQFLLRRYLDIPMRQVWVDILPGTASSLAAAAFGYLALRMLTPLDAPVPVVLAIVGAVAACSYFVPLLLFWRYAAADLGLIAERFVPAAALARIRRARPGFSS
jgi:O-antigen/teichoic acid export membrane protein